MITKAVGGLCKCPCHKEGVSLMHCFPCCNLCYRTYLDKDGNVNEEQLKAELLLNEFNH